MENLAEALRLLAHTQAQQGEALAALLCSKKEEEKDREKVSKTTAADRAALAWPGLLPQRTPPKGHAAQLPKRFENPPTAEQLSELLADLPVYAGVPEVAIATGEAEDKRLHTIHKNIGRMAHLIFDLFSNSEEIPPGLDILAALVAHSLADIKETRRKLFIHGQANVLEDTNPNGARLLTNEEQRRLNAASFSSSGRGGRRQWRSRSRFRTPSPGFFRGRGSFGGGFRGRGRGSSLGRGRGGRFRAPSAFRSEQSNQ